MPIIGIAAHTHLHNCKLDVFQESLTNIKRNWPSGISKVFLNQQIWSAALYKWPFPTCNLGKVTVYNHQPAISCSNIHVLSTYTYSCLIKITLVQKILWLKTLHINVQKKSSARLSAIVTQGMIFNHHSLVMLTIFLCWYWSLIGHSNSIIDKELRSKANSCA